MHLTVVLEKTLESPLDCKEIQPVHPKGDQSWIVLDWRWSWNCNILATQCIELTHWKRPWSWERLKVGEKGMTEDEMVGWHHRLDGHEFEWTPGAGNGPGAIHGVTTGQTRLSSWTELNWQSLPCGWYLIDKLCVHECSIMSRLSDPMDCSLSSASVRGILQARIREWVAIPFSRGPSRLSDGTHISCIAGGFFTNEPPRNVCIGWLKFIFNWCK